MALYRDSSHATMSHVVAAGQQYVQVNAYRNVWEVKDVFHPSDEIAHARLARVDEPSIIKTISCISLAEGAFFELLPDDEPDSDEVTDDDEAADEGYEFIDANSQWRENLEASTGSPWPHVIRRWFRS